MARKATSQLPGDYDFQDTLAHAAYGSGRWHEAVDAWEKVLAAMRNYFSDTSNHVNCIVDRDHYEDARRRAAAQLKADLPHDVSCTTPLTGCEPSSQSRVAAREAVLRDGLAGDAAALLPAGRAGTHRCNVAGRPDKKRSRKTL